MADIKEEKVEVSITENNEDPKLAESLDTVDLNEPETLDSFSKKIEESRQEFFAVYKKQRRWSNILMPVVSAAMVASIVLFVGVNALWGKITGGCIIGAAFIGMVVFYIVTRNKLPNKSKDYIRNFALVSDNYVFSGHEIKNASVSLKKRYAISEFLPDRVYKDIADIASRNIVKFDYKDHHVTCGELALYKRGARRNQKPILFIGKYLNFTNDFHFEDRYIVTIKGEKDVDLPTDIDDLVILKEQNRFVVYGKEGADVEKDLGKDLLNDLKSIDCRNCLYNVNIVIWAGRTSAYLSYDDSICAIPLDKEIDAKSYQQLKKNVGEVLQIFFAK